MNRIVPALLVVLGLALAAPVLARGDNPFPVPAGLEPEVEFWLRVYSEVDTYGGLLHDSRHLDIIYQVIDLPDGSSARSLEKHAERARKSVTTALRSLARGKRKNLNETERRVLAQWPASVSNSTLREAAGRVRFQLGQANKFRAGLIRAGRWEPHIRKTLADMGLPSGLSALPHVESSYNPSAYSRVGAAGLWQFTRSTGRRFMRVDHVVDERLDPYKATISAARLLEQNRKVTGTWPLAITAYNHGASGMRRAVRKVGTNDIEKIVRNYRSRTFGFASRNFYVEFLAALEADLNSEKYFGKLIVDPPEEYDTATLPFYMKADALRRHLGVSLTTLERNNPALRPSVWQGAKYIPKGFAVRLPRGELARPLAAAISDVPRELRLAGQTRDRTYTVRRGDSLSRIASRYDVSERELAQINGLRNRHRIRVGQKLRLPGDAPTRIASSQRAPIAPPADGLHTVRRGDTLSSIATRYGMKLDQLTALNDLDNKHRIHVGQSIRLASSAPSPRRPAAQPTAEAEPAPPPVLVAPQAQREPAVARGPANAVTAATVDLMARASTALPEAEFGPELGPLSEELGESFGPDGLPPLPADPSDYSVADDETIEVQAEETLGHYAEWLNLRASRLRAINGMNYGASLALGDRVELDFSQATREQFEARRIDHHRALQGRFFDRYEISGTTLHVTRRGESLWLLSRKKYQVPLWLLRQYNPDLSLQELQAGTQITIPKLKAHSPSEAGRTTTSAHLQKS